MLHEARPAPVAGGEQLFRQGRAARREIGAGLFLADLLRIVHGGLHAREDPGQLLLAEADKGRYAAVELSYGAPGRPVGAGADQVHDGFGAAEVHAAVQKRAAGEFAGPGGPDAQPGERFHHPRGNEMPAVELEFGHVLPGVCGWFAHQHRHALVDGLPVFVQRAAVGEPVVLKGSRVGDEAAERFLRPRAGDPHDGDAALSGRGGGGCDGVLIEIQFGSSFERRAGAVCDVRKQYTTYRPVMRREE